MKEPPVMQNVGLVSSFYSQEVVCLPWKKGGRLVKISDQERGDSSRRILGEEMKFNLSHSMLGCTDMAILSILLILLGSLPS
jgi:hypothetical protein